MLLLALTLAVAVPASSSDCSDLGPTSTLADQFLCFKTAGRKIVVPGTGFLNGFDGPGCISAVAADRISVSTCGPGTIGRKTITVPLASIQGVSDDPDRGYVTLILVSQTVEVDCRYQRCEQVIYAPAPAPAPAPRPHLMATPPEYRRRTP